MRCATSDAAASQPLPRCIVVRGCAIAITRSEGAPLRGRRRCASAAVCNVMRSAVQQAAAARSLAAPPPPAARRGDRTPLGCTLRGSRVRLTLRSPEPRRQATPAAGLASQLLRPQSPQHAGAQRRAGDRQLCCRMEAAWRSVLGAVQHGAGLRASFGMTPWTCNCAKSLGVVAQLMGEHLPALRAQLLEGGAVPAVEHRPSLRAPARERATSPLAAAAAPARAMPTSSSGRNSSASSTITPSLDVDVEVHGFAGAHELHQLRRMALHGFGGDH